MFYQCAAGALETQRQTGEESWLCNWTQTGHAGRRGGKMHTKDVRASNSDQPQKQQHCRSLLSLLENREIQKITPTIELFNSHTNSRLAPSDFSNKMILILIIVISLSRIDRLQPRCSRVVPSAERAPRIV